MCVLTNGILKRQSEDFKSSISRLNRDLKEWIAKEVSKSAKIEHRKRKQRQVSKFDRLEEKN